MLGTWCRPVGIRFLWF